MLAHQVCPHRRPPRGNIDDAGRRSDRAQVHGLAGRADRRDCTGCLAAARAVRPGVVSCRGARQVGSVGNIVGALITWESVFTDPFQGPGWTCRPAPGHRVARGLQTT